MSLPPIVERHRLWRGIYQTLRQDIFGGALLLGATVLALILANSPAAGWYESVRDFRIGPEALHLDLTIGTWAADGLLAIFFFVVGLELKEEFVAGRLRDRRAALLPIVAAVGGVAVPAIIYAVVNAGSGDALRGWAIPTATDIAFAIAIIAVVGRFLPPALRVFLVTLAIVDDLIAITIIAVGYTDGLNFVALGLALVPLALFAVLVQRGVRAWWILIPLGVLTWVLVHESGVHATVAGVLLGFTVPVVASARARVSYGTDDSGREHWEGLAGHFADRFSGVSTIAVAVFAFFSAGVTTGGLAGFADALGDPIAIGIILGLVLGKPIGIAGTTFLLTRLRGLAIDPSLKWVDMLGLSLVAGVGFTVSLLIGELSFGLGSEADEHVKIGVLTGSFVAALLGGVLLALRNRHYRDHGPKSDLDEDEADPAFG
ncbi:Na+/H+ antiporter NhaA [Desertivibrio insolitus]|uniref:Na+/H+ antiporter NhaA n=1 Tax=Herbiconiux sp. SYSU D00978 TaxID=2812562 RepID=UPI001A95E5DF|nr:Na+/H+ antiporter NhaA [Herbiconiux sp. SYSU D00978]